ncbi:inosine-5-monophosphate dehydrogenase [Algimonas arctica]|uniref:Inosine-5-monophosphate dehydrogenase n=1 Tax=Algimonas arctica TaxID=1479486 RepID=A0A8J3CQ40_9PROT|nr:CBS domain-containing protein [Algimonas arctica]GHA84568.1 inosine-5-monophosphate dehydrogenase [Algimonas arctica]
MSVKAILDAKGQQIYTVPETAKLREAIALLNDKNIGVVLITNSAGKLAGILSERDIVRRSLLQETGFRDELVTKSMTKNVLSVSPIASIDDVMEIMTNSHIRHVPVLDGDEIKGLISIGDVVKRKIAQAENEAAAMRDYIAAG